MQQAVRLGQAQLQNARRAYVPFGVDNKVVQNLLHTQLVRININLIIRQLILQIKISVRRVNQQPPGHGFHQLDKIKAFRVKLRGPGFQGG